MGSRAQVCFPENESLVVKNQKPFFKTLDAFVILMVLAVAAYLAYRIKNNLHYHWEWGVIPQYLLRFDSEKERWVLNTLSQGFFTTIRLSIWSTFLAIPIGTTVGLFRISQSLFYRLIGRAYIEMIRNLPPLVLIFIFYYFVSDQILDALEVEQVLNGLSPGTRTLIAFFFAPPHLLTRFWAALITLAIFEGAYIAEIVRAGIQSIDRGQWEASYAVGLSRRQVLFLVILPQAVKNTLPPLAGQFISTIKDSAIVSLISIPELTFQGMELMSSTYLTFEIWLTITALYLVLTLSLSLLVSRLEQVLQRKRA